MQAWVTPKVRAACLAGVAPAGARGFVLLPGLEPLLLGSLLALWFVSWPGVRIGGTLGGPRACRRQTAVPVTTHCPSLSVSLSPSRPHSLSLSLSSPLCHSLAPLPRVPWEMLSPLLPQLFHALSLHSSPAPLLDSRLFQGSICLFRWLGGCVLSVLWLCCVFGCLWLLLDGDRPIGRTRCNPILSYPSAGAWAV